MNKIITIGREFGSGGRELGNLIAEKLGIAYYDKEIISAIAQKTSLAEEYVNMIMEKNPTPFFPVTVGRSFYPQGDPILKQSNAVFIEQSNIIKEMAQKSDCVIVGRCADYILQDMNPLRLFVYAKMEFKLERCRKYASENEDLSDKVLSKNILNIDKNRARYYSFYTGNEWGAKLNYDILINTSNTPIEKIACAIADIVKSKH